MSHAESAATYAQARQQVEQRWRTAFENSAIGITMADFAGRFFAANSDFRNMLGYTESELHQLTFLDVTYEEDRKANQELIRELVEGKRQHFQIEKRYCRKDDAPALATADVGIAIGSGTDVAVESAGIVLVRSDPRDVVGAIELSRATYRKMIQNLVWATAYNLVAIPAAAGLFVRWGVELPMSVGAVAMNSSTIIVAINAQLLRRLNLHSLGST
jgi:PAS domain S-box-containing protein